jgi:mono/diheme cytochrome c family protein
MKMRSVLLIGILTATGSVQLFPARAQHPDGAKTPTTTSAKTTDRKEGEKRFKENCGRCHHPPESISPRETKAVLRQMRVRAMLTAKDERLILKYLAP